MNHQLFNKEAMGFISFGKLSIAADAASDPSIGNTLDVNVSADQKLDGMHNDN